MSTDISFFCLSLAPKIILRENILFGALNQWLYSPYSSGFDVMYSITVLFVCMVGYIVIFRNITLEHFSVEYNCTKNGPLGNSTWPCLLSDMSVEYIVVRSMASSLISVVWSKSKAQFWACVRQPPFFTLPFPKELFISVVCRNSQIQNIPMRRC